jgi:hypothetical protein
MATFSGLPVELKLRIVKYVNEASHDPASTAKFLTLEPSTRTFGDSRSLDTRICAMSL